MEINSVRTDQHQNPIAMNIIVVLVTVVNNVVDTSGTVFNSGIYFDNFVS